MFNSRWSLMEKELTSGFRTKVAIVLIIRVGSDAKMHLALLVAGSGPRTFLL